MKLGIILTIDHLMFSAAGFIIGPAFKNSACYVKGVRKNVFGADPESFFKSGVGEGVVSEFRYCLF